MLQEVGRSACQVCEANLGVILAVEVEGTVFNDQLQTSFCCPINGGLGNNVIRYAVSMVKVLRQQESCLMKPDACNHNPDPRYLRELIDKAGISQRKAAQLLGMSWTGFRNYLRDESEPLYRVADYRVQFALECLADSTE